MKEELVAVPPLVCLRNAGKGDGSRGGLVSTPASIAKALPSASPFPPALDSRDTDGVGDDDIILDGGELGELGERREWLVSILRAMQERTRGPRLLSAGRMVVGGLARRTGRAVGWSTVIQNDVLKQHGQARAELLIEVGRERRGVRGLDLWRGIAG